MNFKAEYKNTPLSPTGELMGRRPKKRLVDAKRKQSDN